MFILAIIMWAVALIAIAIGIIARSGWVIAGGVFAGLLGFGFWVWSMYYSIEPGDAVVLKDWTGVVVGSNATPGPHWKDPWIDTVTWDIRNQQAAFMGNGNTTHNGQQVTGAEITFTDKDGVTGNMDIAVLFSINPDKIEELTEDYRTQDDFRIKVIENDIKSYPRDVAAKFDTIGMFNDRAQVRDDIEQLLDESWEGTGVQIESVVLHGIRYSDAVKQRFEDAQNAQTEVVKAEAELEKAKIDAQQKVAVATAEAEANRILSESLTPQVLQQRYYDVLSKANLIVVPEGFTALGNLGQAVPQ